MLFDITSFFYRVNFALAYAICSSCVYISNIYITNSYKKKKLPPIQLSTECMSTICTAVAQHVFQCWSFPFHSTHCFNTWMTSESFLPLITWPGKNGCYGMERINKKNGTFPAHSLCKLCGDPTEDASHFISLPISSWVCLISSTPTSVLGRITTEFTRRISRKGSIFSAPQSRHIFFWAVMHIQSIGQILNLVARVHWASPPVTDYI